MILVFEGHNETATAAYKDGNRFLPARHGVPFYIPIANASSVLEKDPRFKIFVRETDPDYEKMLVDIDKKIKNRRKVYFETSYHIGDNLLSIPAICKYLLINPGSDAVITTHKRNFYIWQNIDRVTCLDWNEYSSKKNRINETKIIIRGKEHAHYHDKTRNRSLNIADVVRIPLSIDEAKKYKSHIEFDDRELTKSFKDYSLFQDSKKSRAMRPVAVQLRTSSHLRDWGPNYKNAEKLCELLVADGFTPVLMDAEKLSLEWDGCINVTGMLDIPQYFYVVAKCDFAMILGDTGGEHVAGNLGTPFIAMFTAGIKPEARISHYNNCIGMYRDKLEEVSVSEVYDLFKDCYNKVEGTKTKVNDVRTSKKQIKEKTRDTDGTATE